MVRRLPLAPLLAVPVVIVTVLAVALGVADGDRADTTGNTAGDAVQTAKDYVNAAAVEQNGLYACRYLTGEQQRAVAAKRQALNCREAVAYGAPYADGVPDSVNAVHKLSSTSRRTGATVRVQLGDKGERLTFVLRRANQSERDSSFSPQSTWRIERGAGTLFGG